MADAFLDTLAERYATHGLRVGTPPDPVALVPAKHPEVGDLKVWTVTSGESSVGLILSVELAVGDLLHDHFTNFDTHLSMPERSARLTGEVVRFLDYLFADKLLFWKSLDVAVAGWRERGAAGHAEPLVIDDRTYRLYVWSEPLGTWRATSRVLALVRIADDREYEIVRGRLQYAGADGFNEPLSGEERERAARLAAEYERAHGI